MYILKGKHRIMGESHLLCSQQHAPLHHNSTEEYGPSRLRQLHLSSLGAIVMSAAHVSTSCKGHHSRVVYINFAMGVAEFGRGGGSLIVFLHPTLSMYNYAITLAKMALSIKIKRTSFSPSLYKRELNNSVFSYLDTSTYVLSSS